MRYVYAMQSDQDELHELERLVLLPTELGSELGYRLVAALGVVHRAVAAIESTWTPEVITAHVKRAVDGWRDTYQSIQRQGN